VVVLVVVEVVVDDEFWCDVEFDVFDVDFDFGCFGFAQ